MSNYRATRTDQRVADDFLASHLACRKCGTSSPRSDVDYFGGMCKPCYDAYCAEANPAWWPNRPLTQSERSSVIAKAKSAMAQLGKSQADPRRWARQLKAREEGGEKLSPVQKLAWRAALGAHRVLDAAKAGANIPAESITDSLRATGDIPWADEDIPYLEDQA